MAVASVVVRTAYRQLGQLSQVCCCCRFYWYQHKRSDKKNREKDKKKWATNLPQTVDIIAAVAGEDAAAGTFVGRVG